MFHTFGSYGEEIYERATALAEDAYRRLQKIFQNFIEVD